MSVENSSRPMAFHLLLRSYEYSASSLALCGIEAFILIIALTSVTWFGEFLKKQTLLHVNLRILCANNCLGSCCYIFIRFLILSDRIHPVVGKLVPDGVYEVLLYMKDGMQQFFMLNLTTILFERWWSTVYANHYEHYFRLPHIVSLFVFPWLVTTGLAIGIHILPWAAFIIFIVTIDVSCFIGFISLFVYNKRLLQRNSQKSLSYTFQVRENVKTIKLLSYLSIIFVFHILCCWCIAFFFFQYSRKIQAADSYIFWHSFFNTFFSIQCLLLSLGFQIHLFKKRNKVGSAPLENYSAEVQRILYFSELRKQWC